MKKAIIFSIALLGAIALFATACGSDDDEDSSRLDTVRDRDMLICGVRDSLPMFGTIDSGGNNAGFDIDFCRVIAAAVLGDADKVEFKLLETSERFTALQSGEIDVLVRNTTWTATRDGDEASNFVFTTFYDGQGVMVPASSNVRELEDLAGANICVAAGTTTEQNLTSIFDQRNIPFNPNSFSDVSDLQSAYEAGQCEAWTSDISQLTAFKNTIEAGGGEEQVILNEVISKEPLGPAVLDGDTRWAQAVRWAVMSTVQAWEFGITSTNIGSADLSNPNINRFLGNDDVGDFDPGIGLDSDFAVNVISQVGNYEEIYNRNIVGLPLAGSINDLWLGGGLLYTPPYR